MNFRSVFIVSCSLCVVLSAFSANAEVSKLSNSQTGSIKGISEGCKLAKSKLMPTLSEILSEENIKKTISEAIGKNIIGYDKLCLEIGTEMVGRLTGQGKYAERITESVTQLGKQKGTPDIFTSTNGNCEETPGYCQVGALYYITKQPDMNKRLGFMAGYEIKLLVLRVTAGVDKSEVIKECLDTNSESFSDCMARSAIPVYNEYNK